MVKIKHWMVAFLLSLGISLLLGGFAEKGIPYIFGRALGVIFILLLIIVIISNVAMALKKPVSDKSLNRVFYISLILLMLLQVRSIAAINKTNRNQKYITDCVASLKKQIKENPSLLNYDLRSYCECASQRSKSLTPEDTVGLSDPNSAAFVELFGPCWDQAKIADSLSGINKDLGADTVMVINLSGHIQVKTKVNGIEVFMIFDSGATDVFISRTFLDQFKAGQVKYLEEYSYYTMADGSQIKAQLATIQQFELGQFKLKDVRVAVSEEMVSPLLGKSILDKFSSWTINSENQLILVP